MDSQQLQTAPRQTRFFLKSGAALLAALCVACVASVAQACPMCKEAIAADSGGGDLISGYFWSIVFMMSMPFALIGTFGLYAYLQVRKARNAMTDETTSDSPEQPE